jgi:hypothetical protein
MALKLTKPSGAGDRREEDLSNTMIRLHSRQEFVDEINRLWGEANDKFIAIGRYLIQAKQVLAHGEYQPMIEQDLPFRPATARRIVAATQAIINQVLPVERLPANYSTVYELSTLTDEERTAAERQGLIRPDVRRNEVLAFKRALSQSHQNSHDRLKAERDRLLNDQRRIEARLLEIDAALRGTVIDLDAADVSETANDETDN